MSGARGRLDRDDVLADAMKRIRTLERQQAERNRMPWFFSSSDITGLSIDDGETVTIEHDGLETAPLNRGGTLDEDVFVFTSPASQVGLLGGGLFLVNAQIAWFDDWPGTTHTWIDVLSTGPGFPAVPTLNIWEDFNSLPARSLTDTATHRQVILTARKLVSVDADAEGVTVEQKIINLSGGPTRTFVADTPNPNVALLTILRLSPHGASNPL